jgi:predicted dehydrogenase
VPPHVGLVGCGLWGRNILRDLLAEGAAVCVADPNEEARAFAPGLGATRTVHSLEALPEVEALVVDNEELAEKTRSRRGLTFTTDC